MTFLTAYFHIILILKAVLLMQGYRGVMKTNNVAGEEHKLAENKVFYLKIFYLTVSPESHS